MMTVVEAEATALEVTNKVEDTINGLPTDVPSARIDMIEARAALFPAAEALADAVERHR